MKSTANKSTALFGALVAAGLAFALPHGSAAADDFGPYCVRCSDPPQTYTCHVRTFEDGEMATPASTVCASEMATLGGHAACAVVRRTDRNCEGVNQLVDYTGPMRPPEPEAALGGSNAANEPPKTLIEATDRAVKGSGEQISKAGRAVTGAAKTAAQNTGRAVGGAAKSTGQTIKNTGETIKDAGKSVWECVSSLFTSC